jgi:hypothetical protein
LGGQRDRTRRRGGAVAHLDEFRRPDSLRQLSPFGTREVGWSTSSASQREADS